MTGSTSSKSVPGAHLSSGTAALMTTKGIGLILNLANFLILPRLLGPSNWGVYVVWVSLWGISTEIFESGVGVVMNRFLPILRCEKPERILRFQHGLLVLKLAILPLVWIIGWRILGSESSEIFHNFFAFSLVILAALFYSWASLDAGLLFNFHRMLAFGSFAPANLLLRLVAVILFCHFMGQAGVPAGMFFGSLALVIVYLCLAYPLIRDLEKYGTRGFYLPFREFLQFGLWVGLGQFCFGAVARLPGLCAETLNFGKEEIGYMGLALFCYGTVRVLSGSILFSLLPHLVTLSHQEQQEEFHRASSEGWRYTNLFLFYSLIGIFSLAPRWFPLFLGKGYMEAMPKILSLLEWTIPAMIFGVWLNFYQQLIYAQGRQRVFIGAAVLVLVAFPLGIFFAPSEIGIGRILVALGVSMAVGTFYLVFRGGWKQWGMKASLIPLLLFFLILYSNRWFELNAGYRLLYFFCIQTPFYLLILWFFRLITPTDIKRIREVLLRLNGRSRFNNFQ